MSKIFAVLAACLLSGMVYAAEHRECIDYRMEDESQYRVRACRVMQWLGQSLIDMNDRFEAKLFDGEVNDYGYHFFLKSEDVRIEPLKALTYDLCDYVLKLETGKYIKVKLSSTNGDERMSYSYDCKK